MKLPIYCSFLAILLTVSCQENTMMHDPYSLIINFKFDGTADRLDNLGNPVSIPEGHAAQTPEFEQLGIHFLGVYPDKFTPYSEGVTLLSTETTDKGGIAAIDFEKEIFIDKTNNQIKIKLSDIEPGIYEYLRSSLAFQRYDIDYNLKGAQLPNGMDDDIDAVGKVASFLGYNTYIDSYEIDQTEIAVKANKAQGYFGLESSATINGFDFSEFTDGSAPQTTVPNPINDTSPVPAGSCVVSGNFPTMLVIPEDASSDIVIDVVISTNNSFEWVDGNNNGKYEPLLGELVVDMGTRGFFPSIRK